VIFLIEVKTLLTNQKYYEKVFSKYYSKVLDDFDFRNKKIKIAFSETERATLMKVSQFLVNTILWKPFLIFKKEFKKEFIFNTNNINANTISIYIDNVIKEFLTETNQLELNKCINLMIEELGMFSLDFNIIIGNTINIKDKIDLAKRNPRYNEIIHKKFDSNISTEAVEKELEQMTKELIHILSIEDNCFKDYINCKEGVNTNQLTQFEINIGPKPDLTGNVFPKIVNTNFLVNGLNTPSDYFIDSSGGRKAKLWSFIQ